MRFKTALRVFFWKCAIALCLPGIAWCSNFMAVGLPGSQLVSLSADGRIAAGSISGGKGGGFRWVVGGEAKTLDGAVAVHGMSAGGGIVAGSTFDDFRREVASYWDEKGALHRLRNLPRTVERGGLLSSASGATDDARIVGVANDADDHLSAVVWDRDELPRKLDVPEAAINTRAQGISADGRTIYGGFQPGSGDYRGMVWSDDGLHELAQDDHRYVSEVLGGNRLGDILIGGNAARGNAAVYRWSALSGIEFLPVGDHVETISIRPLASSDDGRIVVGSAGIGGARFAVVWHAGAGPERIDTILPSLGATAPAGWRLCVATAVSADGSRIGGWGERGGVIDSFVLDLSQRTGDEAAPTRSGE